MMKKVYRKKLDAKAKAAKAKIQKKSGGDQFKNLKDWVAFYKENDRLPSQKITCSNCKKKQTSMFGDNLKRTLPKFGSIEKLLTQFECADCRKAKAPVREVKVKVPKRVNSEAESITVKGNSAKEYLTVDEIEDRKEKIRATLPKFNPDFKPAKIDFKDADSVGELTAGACQRPDIYFDAGCKYCPMVDLCKCVSKDLKRDVINEGRSSKRRK
jgi:hypothetical protein